jgi:hypothetical protein
MSSGLFVGGDIRLVPNVRFDKIIEKRVYPTVASFFFPLVHAMTSIGTE